MVQITQTLLLTQVDTIIPTQFPAPHAVLPMISPPPKTLEPTLPPPTNTPEPIPDVVISYSGIGASIVDLDIEVIGGYGVMQVQGNHESRHFAVLGYDQNGVRTELYVNTTEPYYGRRALNLRENENTVRLEINATGSWEITLFSLSENLLTTINAPGSFAGKGDDVLLLKGLIPDKAIVTGNVNANHFALIAYSKGVFARDLLINTSEPYNGEVLLDNDCYVHGFTASGNWTIDITSR